MELNYLIKLIGLNKKKLITAMLVGIVFGFGAYALPGNHLASGSIYVGRITDNSTTFFTYEGFYGQQTALTYTNSVLGLLQSTDLLKDTLIALQKPTSEYEIWKLKRSIVAKKAGPQTQVINLTTKAKSPQEATDMWNAIYASMEGYTTKINSQSDPALKIYKVSEKPISRQPFKSLPLFLVAGVGISFSLFLANTLLSEYIKEGKSK